MTQHEFLEMLRENHAKMLLNKREVAAELGISQTGIDRLRQTGQLKSRKVLGQVMFDIGELSRYLSEVA